jgi:hypothetical protein
MFSGLPPRPDERDRRWGGRFVPEPEMSAYHDGERCHCCFVCSIGRVDPRGGMTMRIVGPSVLSLIGLIGGNFVYEVFRFGEWSNATERSFFQVLAVLLTAIAIYLANTRLKPRA